jgi:hypothetical protein
MEMNEMWCECSLKKIFTLLPANKTGGPLFLGNLQSNEGERREEQ